MESEVFLEPEPRQWIALAQQMRSAEESWRGRMLAEWRTLTRRDLGLPEEKIIIATGHQAGFWHPGILAKFFAVDAVVNALGRERAVALHLVVDQDDNDCTHLDVPVVDEQGGVSAQRVRIVEENPEQTGSAGRATCAIPALPAKPSVAAGLRPAAESVAKGLASIEASLRAHDGASSLAAQMALAVQDHLRGFIAEPPVIFAGQLLRTCVGGELIEMMRADPLSCAAAYNSAVVGGGKEVRPLDTSAARVELPLWRLDAGIRQPVFASELADIEPSLLLPRALLMTAIMRIFVCDLFIHGRGGFDYDRAMEGWVREWLNLPVCPMTMATADVRLPMPGADHADEDAVEHALRRVRRLAHDPAVRDGAISPQKRRWLEEINAAPHHSRERREKFFAYHRWLESARESNAAMLRDAEAHLRRTERRAASRETLRRRDWAFPLYPREALDGLNETIRGLNATTEAQRHGESHL